MGLLLKYLCLAMLFCGVLSAFSASVAEEADAPDAQETEAAEEEKEFGAVDINTTVDIDGAKAVVLSYSEIGCVDLLTVSYLSADTEDNSMADNSTVQHVLVNGSPAAIPVEKTVTAKINIKDDPKYSKFISVHPNLALSTAGVEFEKVQTVGADGLRYNFLFILRDGCTDCSASGYARIAFDFDKDGEFIKTVLVKLMKTRQPL
ncbi:MAG: hypothetical protein HQK97_11435 [Nitrospirae bacterium]|nr:hypothetical protein [Nitrospirota bacterium]